MKTCNCSACSGWQKTFSVQLVPVNKKLVLVGIFDKKLFSLFCAFNKFYWFLYAEKLKLALNSAF